MFQSPSASTCPCSAARCSAVHSRGVRSARSAPAWRRCSQQAAEPPQWADPGVGKLRENGDFYGKTMGNHRKMVISMGKPWENHRKMVISMGKPWETIGKW